MLYLASILLSWPCAILVLGMNANKACLSLVLAVNVASLRAHFPWKRWWEAYMLVPICTWHHHLAPWLRKADNFWSTWMDFKQIFSSQWKKKVSFHFWILTSTGNWTALKVTKSIGGPPIPIFIYTRIHITTLHTVSPGFPDPQSQSSLWSGFPYSRTGISHQLFPENGYSPQQIRWALKPAT